MQKINLDGYPEFVTYTLDEERVFALIQMLQMAEVKPGHESELPQLLTSRAELQDGIISLETLALAIDLCQGSRPKWYRRFLVWWFVLQLEFAFRCELDYRTEGV